MRSLLLTLLCGSALLPLAPALAQSGTAQPTAQQAFDAATAAFDAERFAEALAQYDALRARTRNAQSLAIIDLRRGQALARIGRDAEAISVLRNAIAKAGTDDASLAADIADAGTMLARVYAQQGRLGEALASFRGARQVEPRAAGRTMLDGSIAFYTGFIDPPASVPLAQSYLAARLAEKAAAPVEADARQVLGRALLNAGRSKEALAEFKQAVTLLGGLTTRVSVVDVNARSDAAIAALLAGDRDEAVDYFAFTGAGRFKGQQYLTTAGELPGCGENGLDPKDQVVMEVGIGDDGAVTRVMPVYASRPGIAEAFARVLSSWRWSPDAAAAIHPFYRASTRLSLRCSVRPERPPFGDLLAAQTGAWLTGRGQPVDLSEQRAIVPLLAETAPPLARLANALAVLRAANGSDDREAALVRADALLTQTNAPAAARALVAILDSREAPSGMNAPAALRRAMSDPLVAADPEALAAVYVRAGDLVTSRLNGAFKREMYQRAATLPGLAAKSPYRIAALVGLASAQARDGDIDAAQTTFAKSGLSAEQCAVLAAQPNLTDVATNRHYPDAVLRRGIQGYTRGEMDIAADGRTVNPRIVLSYPPLLFDQSSTAILANARYEKSFRPGNSLGCAGAMTIIRFVMPD